MVLQLLQDLTWRSFSGPTWQIRPGQVGVGGPGPSAPVGPNKCPMTVFLYMQRRVLTCSARLYSKWNARALTSGTLTLESECESSRMVHAMREPLCNACMLTLMHVNQCADDGNCHACIYILLAAPRVRDQGCVHR